MENLVKGHIMQQNASKVKTNNAPMPKRKFSIVVKETLSRVVEVRAEDLDDAISQVETMYYDLEEIVLDSSDSIEVEFSPYNGSYLYL